MPYYTFFLHSAVSSFAIIVLSYRMYDKFNNPCYCRKKVCPKGAKIRTASKASSFFAASTRCKSSGWWLGRVLSLSVYYNLIVYLNYCMEHFAAKRICFSSKFHREYGKTAKVRICRNLPTFALFEIMRSYLSARHFLSKGTNPRVLRA